MDGHAVQVQVQHTVSIHADEKRGVSRDVGGENVGEEACTLPRLGRSIDTQQADALP